MGVTAVVWIMWACAAGHVEREEFYLYFSFAALSTKSGRRIILGMMSLRRRREFASFQEHCSP